METAPSIAASVPKGKYNNPANVIAHASYGD